MAEYFLGVDVGTGSVRAAVASADGRLLSRATRPLQLRRPRDLYYEQSSSDVWAMVCQCVRQAVSEAGVQPAEIRGIGFDATCSLVVLDRNAQPLPVSPPVAGEKEKEPYDIILWMDHRARAETEAINRTGHDVLDFVGGKMSPEMQMGKLRWLKTHMPDTWARAGYFFDLPDYLTFRATGSLSRSLCSLVCKWTFVSGALNRQQGFDPTFLSTIGLEDLLENDGAKLGARQVLAPGTPVAQGLSAAAAEELGLLAGVPVAAGSIDAHAGVLGVIAARVAGEPVAVERRLALVLGTSSCHMALSQEMIFVPGVWGPYHEVVLPNYWLSEGGQSAAGALLDHVVAMHAGSSTAKERATGAGISVFEWLNREAERCAQAAGLTDALWLCRDLHVLDSFHGNRSPLADPNLKGMIYGLELHDDPLDDLLRLYVATVVALALGTRAIIEAMNKAGHQIETLAVCGGLCKNRLLLQAHADVTGCQVILPQEEDAVLLGAAVLGAAASRAHGGVLDAAMHMNHASTVLRPRLELKALADAKFKVYQMMAEHQRWAASVMRTFDDS